MNDMNFTYSIWRINSNKGLSNWMAAKIESSSPLGALKKAMNGGFLPGLYFVCDAGRNPHSGEYGPTAFWVDAHQNIFVVTDIHRTKDDNNIHIDVGEMIEI